jgi:hypothetical protein
MVDDGRGSRRAGRQSSNHTGDFGMSMHNVITAFDDNAADIKNSLKIGNRADPVDQTRNDSGLDALIASQMG